MKWIFNDMLHTKARYEESNSSTSSAWFSDFLFPPQKLPHTFSHASQTLLSTAFNIFLKAGSWNSCFTWGPTYVAVSPSKSTLQCSTAVSYKITLPHPFLERSTAEAVIQVADSWFWGGSSRSNQPAWSNVALWYCTLKKFGLPSY